MKIAVVGTGYVGLVTGVCLAHVGHNVTCIDVNDEKIQLLTRGEPPNYEPRLEELLVQNLEANRLHFTSDYSEGCKSAEVIIIAVGTPMKKDGEIDLTDFYKAGILIAQYIVDKTVIVTKSTVPVGTNGILKKLISKTIHNNQINFSVVSNPEFLREGSAIEDTFCGERIVIGSDDEYAADVMRRMYASFQVPIIQTDIRSAEMIKYASNTFLATKISFINEMASLCEKIEANIDDVAKGMGLDSRIGTKFLQAGIGFGGSCLPKDLKTFHKFAMKLGHPLPILDEVIKINIRQQYKLIQKAKDRFGSLKGKRIALLGLAFKPNTDDVREAPSVDIANELFNSGASVIAYDPVAMKRAKTVLPPDIEYAGSIREVLMDVDMVFILTEWDEMLLLNPKIFSDRMKTPIVFDGRNCYSLELMKKYSIEYHSIGRPTVSNIIGEKAVIGPVLEM
jgi:UDPglucose 6-dehydrogenase